MNYPIEILPNPYRKLFTCAFQQHRIIRAIKESPQYQLPKNRNDIGDSKTNHIKEQYVCSPSHQIADLSVSLYGIFKNLHNEIELESTGKDIYNKDCSADEQIKPPIFKEHFLMIPRLYWWMEAEKMHLQTIPLIYNGTEYTVRCHIVHSPMKWNFWHFSFRWEIEGLGYLHQLEANLKKKLTDKIKKIGKGQVIMHAKWSELEPFKLDKSCYTKSIPQRIGIWLKNKFTTS